jgi:hypothetical protein
VNGTIIPCKEALNCMTHSKTAKRQLGYLSILVTSEMPLDVLVEKANAAEAKVAKAKVIYDPDEHCGVIEMVDGTTVPCNSHTKTEKRQVGGRSKEFDVLVAEVVAAEVKVGEAKEAKAKVIYDPDKHCGVICI